MRGWEGRLWAVYSSATGTVLIAAGAFWLSFVALADLARRSGIASGQAWIWPLLVDGLIVVATVAAVALDGRPAAWYPWTLLICGALVSVIANALHAVVTAEATMPVLLAAAVAAVPPLVLLASTHLTVVLIRSLRHPHAPEPTLEKLVSLPAVIPPAADMGPAEGGEPQQLAPDPDPLSEPVPDAEPEPGLLVPEDGRRAEAARLRQELGWSNKRIARELGVHASTVGRWFRHPDPMPADPDPVLAERAGSASDAETSGDGSEEPATGVHPLMKETTP